MGKKKGKAQNGRAKQKQKAKGSSPRTPMSQNQRFARQMQLDDDWEEEDNPIRFRGFAQSAPSPFVPRSANAKLRHQAISFVSAGVNSPVIEPPQLQDAEGKIVVALDDTDEEEEDEDEDEFDDTTIQTNIILDADIELSEQGVANMNIQASGDTMDVDHDAVAPAQVSDLPFVIDTVGDATLTGGFKANGVPRRRSPSPAASDSGDEVIVFHGRNRGKPTIIDDPVGQHSSRATSAAPRHAAHTERPAIKPARKPLEPPVVTWSAVPFKSKDPIPESDKWEAAPDIPYWKKGKGKARPDLNPPAAELEANEQSTHRRSTVKFADEVKDDVTTSVSTISKTNQPSRRNKRGRKASNRAMRNVVLSDDEEEDGNESEAAYIDYMENLKAQLEAEGETSVSDLLKDTFKHSKSISGPSMVVDGMEIADDEVLSKHQQSSPTGELDDEDWETDDSEMNELNPDLDEISTDESPDASELEDELEYSERQQWQDEDDLRQRRIEAMNDETIARLLAKQDELGISGDDLVLEDDVYGLLSEDGVGDLDDARAGLRDITNSTFGRKAGKQSARRGKRSDFFPDASALADTVDQYGENGFDIMDMDRPSLRPTKKGRKGKLPPELESLSDEELRETMHSQWDKDRAKKRQKKLEREELRAEGLLGSAGRKGKPDLKAKYPLGMNMRNVHDELRDFLQNEDLQQRAFPPMDKVNRKALHEICTALNLKSKSQGSGSNRFPIIYKTSQTEDYSSGMFEQVLNVATRGFLTNAKARKMAKNGPQRAGRGGGFDKAAVSLRDGDVVGAGAAAIGKENRGFALMQRMGWKEGAGLGKDGEGRREHVEQIVKINKGGLG